MTESWEQKGIWEAYKNDLHERLSSKPHLVRPSPLPVEDYMDTYVGQSAKQYLRNYSSGQPFFCKISFGGPHEPWDAPEPYASMYSPRSMPAALKKFKDTAKRPVGSIDSKPSPELSEQEVQAMRANYAGNISLIDDQIGEILETLENKGVLDNTLILFTSDHGEMNGDHGFIHKGNMLDAAVRVPLIIAPPKASHSPFPSKHSSPVEWIDIGPTIVEYAQGSINYQQYGRSLKHVIDGKNDTHRVYAISEYNGEVMIMNQQWKLVVNKFGEPYLLFDRKNDPDEQANLAGNKDYQNIEFELCKKILCRLLISQPGQ